MDTQWIDSQWKEFRKTGLLWWINRSLHLFGWALVYHYNGEELVAIYPMRVSYRGFSSEDEEMGFHALTKYLHQNAEGLVEEVGDDGNKN